MSIESVLKDEILNELESVRKMELGSDQHVKTVGTVNSMVDRLSESQKLDNEKKRLEIEERKSLIEAARLESEKKDRNVKNVITIGTTLLYTGVMIWANIDSKRFEQGYTHTTEAGKSSSRALLNLLSKNK
jgi:exonuclease III